MIDVTQSMACIHCGACVSDCLSMEVDPLFIGPAALAKAYRFVGDPRDGADRGAPARPRRGPARDLRLHALLQLRRGLPEGRRADGPDHAPAPPRDARLRDQRPEQRPPPRAGVHEDHPQEGHPRRAQAAPGQLRRRSGPQGGIAAAARPADRPARLRARQDHAAGRRCSTRGSRACENMRRIYEHAENHAEELNLYILGEEARTTATETDDRAGEASRSEGRLLARLRLARLHPGAARLDGAGRRQARHRAGRARPRELLRRRRDRRAQPGAGRHAQRAHLRDGAEDRPLDDEHLLDLPGRAVRVPAAPRRRRRLPRRTSTRCSRPRASTTSAGVENKNFLWLLVEDYGLDRLQELVVRPLTGLRVGPVLRLLRAAPDLAPRLRRPPRARPLPRAA